jgi:hypothetical protein
MLEKINKKFQSIAEEIATIKAQSGRKN